MRIHVPLPEIVSHTCFGLTHKAAAWLRTGKGRAAGNFDDNDCVPCSSLCSFLSAFFLASSSSREQFSSLAASFTNPCQAPLPSWHPCLVWPFPLILQHLTLIERSMFQISISHSSSLLYVHDGNEPGRCANPPQVSL